MEGWISTSTLTLEDVSLPPSPSPSSSPPSPSSSLISSSPTNLGFSPPPPRFHLPSSPPFLLLKAPSSSSDILLVPDASSRDWTSLFWSWNVQRRLKEIMGGRSKAGWMGGSAPFAVGIWAGCNPVYQTFEPAPPASTAADFTAPTSIDDVLEKMRESLKANEEKVGKD
ncbi:hypothetical protein BDY24DRAFT_438958 [Mrakia frigida]|uniref:uncharacterized protein n=1 Tax=Mrakia frigida TaxID=29902 RepID=UPI003FCC2603